MKGLSQENVADMFNLSLLAYGDIERGKKDVTYKRIEQIADKLGVSVQDILSYGDRVSNFFDQCENTNVNTGKTRSQNTNNYDQKDLVHKLEIQKLKLEKMALEVAKMKAEKEKAEAEVLYLKDKLVGRNLL